MENEICYYCNISTFKSIIENQTFWLSDLHFMNDSSEEALFLEALADVMMIMRDGLSEETKKHLEKNRFMDEYFTNIKYKYKNIVYICCFTEGKNDDLSQWRGYADDGQGLCIGFKKESIKELSRYETISRVVKESDNIENKSNVSISKVFTQSAINYADKEQIITELKNKIAPLVEKYDNVDKKRRNSSYSDVEFTQDLYRKTFNYKAFYKNKSFESEREYRICFFDSLHEGALGVVDDSLMKHMQAKYKFKNGVEISELKFRIGRGTLIPYREMKFTMEYFKKMLASITIGPKNPMSIEDVKYFLVSNGFDTSNIEIQKSESTYQ